jgi:hypothetical protein
METIKQTLSTGWNFMRWLRLVFGIFFTIQGIQSSDRLMGVVGAFFLITALTNTSCGGSGACAIKNVPDNSKKNEESDLKE